VNTCRSTAEQACEIIRRLPEDRLRLVLRFLKVLESEAQLPDRSGKTSVAPLYTIHKAAIRTGIPDLAHRHDVHLYAEEPLDT
jgi:hypothetical protein